MLHARLRASAGRDRIPTDGLVAWYTMDNISGSTLVDEMGNYDGTITGATQVPGVIGQALAFDGSDYVIAPSVLIPTNTFTVSTWVTDSSGSGDRFYISQYTSGLSGRTMIYKRNPENEYRFFNSNGGITVIGTPSASGFDNITIACDSGNADIYLNNTFITSRTGISMLQVDTVIGSGYGASAGTIDSSRNIVADVDECFFYSKKLAADERTQIYERGV